jgi:hypothetical protein
MIWRSCFFGLRDDMLNPDNKYTQPFYRNLLIRFFNTRRFTQF